MSKQVDFLMKLRDGLQQCVDAIQEELEKRGPQKEEPSRRWDPSKIKWTQEEGPKGPFEKSEDFNSPDHKALLQDLKVHKGKMTHEGLFMWLFEDGQTIGRKKNKF